MPLVVQDNLWGYKMLIVSLQPVPSQFLATVLNGQNCQIFIYKKGKSLFVDLNSNGTDIVSCVIARDMVPLVCIEYTGFVGNIIFMDMNGSLDPEYLGLGDRYRLIYLSQSEYESAYK